MINRKLIHKYPKTAVLFLVLWNAAIGQTTTVTFAQGQGSMTVTGKTVRIHRLPASWAVVRDVQGGYEKHPQVFEEMMRYVGANFRALGDCFGVYPMDPDAVRNGGLSWQVGVRVVPGEPLGFGKSMPMSEFSAKTSRQLQQDRRRLKEPAAPYRLVLLESVEAAVFNSSVEEAPKDGLSIFRWMAENGYVQIGSTRMEYLSHEGPPKKIPTRIIVPVRKRPSGLSVGN